MTLPDEQVSLSQYHALMEENTALRAELNRIRVEEGKNLTALTALRAEIESLKGEVTTLQGERVTANDTIADILAGVKELAKQEKCRRPLKPGVPCKDCGWVLGGLDSRKAEK